MTLIKTLGLHKAVILYSESVVQGEKYKYYSMYIALK